MKDLKISVLKSLLFNRYIKKLKISFLK
jgi:hypothetical protein